MPLISINLTDKQSSDFLSALNRIAHALERIAGPELKYNPEPATLKDYAIVTPEDADRIRKAGYEFGVTHQVVPGSPAYVAAVEEYERMVADAYGPEAIESLPWRVKTGNPPDPSQT
jgi:hypothetical protein